MMEIPLTSDGARSFRIDTGVDVYTFRTYYAQAALSLWLLDIYDADGVLLLGGLALVAGSENILKGQGDTMRGYQLYVYQEPLTSQSDPEGLGVFTRIVLYNPGETNYYSVGDPLLTITKEDYVFS